MREWNEKYKVSVIIPVYQVKEYLDRCINSVVNQLYSNLEIIIIDDGSNDGSSAICDKWQTKDNRIKVIHKTNGGLSDARNVGIQEAKGQYISFVDSDDFVNEKFILTLISDAVEYNADISCVGYSEFEEIDDLLPIYQGNTVVFTREEAVKSLLKIDGPCNYAWNKLYKRELFDNVKFPVGKKMEDLGTTYLLMDKCVRVVYNSTKLYNYMQRKNSILHTTDEKFFKDKMEMTIRRYVYLKKNYGVFQENIDFLLITAFECYSFLPKNDTIKNSVKNELETIWKKNKKIMTNRRKIKYLLLIYNERLYRLLFMRKRGEN